MPAIMLPPLAIGFFTDPLWMFEDLASFQLFGMFFGLPWLLAGFLVFRSFRVKDDAAI